MRILLANKFFYPKGGAETVFFQERSWLIKHGHHVADFSMTHEKNVESPFAKYFVPEVDYDNRGGPIAQIKTAVRFIHNAEATRRIAILCDDFKPQVAHLHNIYHQLTPSIIPTLKSKGVKVVLTIHDGKMVCPAYVMLRAEKPCIKCTGQRFWNAAVTNCKGSLVESGLLSIESLFHRFKGSYGAVDRILSPSKFLADLIIESGYPEEQVTVIKNGIDVKGYAPSSSGGCYALYYGRLSREKGLQTLCRASNNFRLPLRVVGTGPLSESLQAQYPDIQFDGFLSGKPLVDAIKGARCVIVPSEWYENCSMVVLESMALGKPIVGSRIGGIPEQIVDNETGLLFTPGDVQDLTEKVNLFADFPQKAKAFGKRARNRLEAHYSLTNHFQQLSEIYNTVVTD